jgi:crotonobetainyl-CoA:carnitine CoA-transferase CaiB-like acyl-CoA transferase
VSRPPARTGEHGEDVLASFGFAADEIRRLRESKAIA